MGILLGILLGFIITFYLALIKIGIWTKNDIEDVKRPLSTQYRTLRAEGKEPAAQRRKQRTQYRQFLANHKTRRNDA